MDWKRLKLAFASTSLAALFAPSIAVAGATIFDNTVSTCTGVNCSSLTIPGTVIAAFGNSEPFEIDVFAFQGECVRLDVTSQGVDLELVAVAPNGTVYRNDDRGADTRPLVKIDPTPNSGWNTVHVAPFNGAADYADFVLRYGRYPSANPNCADATPPLALEEAKSAGSGAVDPPAPGTRQ